MNAQTQTYVHSNGYRSYDRRRRRQVELRKQNCGTTRYAIYRMPASECSPPTARPGTSMHERGEAMDFYKKGRNGEAVPIAGTGAFHWLKRNAGSYGLYNLPSEPWHWSTNGR
jgi:LAS superfamily LD-carboxypeptidase LdcB